MKSQGKISGQIKSTSHPTCLYWKWFNQTEENTDISIFFSLDHKHKIPISIYLGCVRECRVRMVAKTSLTEITKNRGERNHD